MSIEQTAITTMRTLAMDAVEKAGSGHPGTAMALAPVVYTVWQDYLRFDPEDPIWPNRDRFVLSIGHASIGNFGQLLGAKKQPVGDVKIVDEKLTHAHRHAIEHFLEHADRRV